jgi:methionyl aminopeptidase
VGRRLDGGTIDGSRSAQFEHTVVVTDDGVDLLTVTADGRSAAGPWEGVLQG